MTMLTTRTHPRLRPLQAGATVNRALAVCGASVLRPRPTVQTRTFRFHIWSFYLDPAYQRELLRRHQSIKQNCVENINRRLPWYNRENPLAEATGINFKRVLAQFRAPTLAQYGLRWVSQGVVGSQKSAPPRQTPPGDPDPQGQDYVIDPITNRRVPKGGYQLHEATLEPSATAFELYKTQVAPFDPYIQETEKRPIHSNGKPPPTELRKYAETEVDDWSATDPPASVDTEDLPTQLSKYAEIEVDDWSATENPTSTDAEDLPTQLSKYAEIEFDDWSTTEKPMSTDAEDLSTQPFVAPRGLSNAKLRDTEYSLNHLPPEDMVEDQAHLHNNKTQMSSELSERAPDVPNRYSTVGMGYTERNSDLNLSSHSASEEGQLQNELKDYGPYTYNEGQPTTADTQSVDDLEGYQYDVSAEPGISPTETSTENVNDLEKYAYDATEEPVVSPNPSPVYEDLDKYEYTAVGETETKEQPFEQYGDLEKYKVFRGQDLDTMVPPERDTVEDSLKEFDDKEQDTPTFDTIDAYDSNVSEAILKQESPKDIEPTQSDVWIETCLNRRAYPRNIHLTPTFNADLYSKAPQGIETSFAEEHGGKHTMPLYTSHYDNRVDQAIPESIEHLSELYSHRDPEIDGILPSEAATLARNQKPVQSDEPTLYKVLAYNPTMQTIDLVETSSTVADLTAPLSPTEVLPRLSNPTKFFPYFARLHAEGFEIVSGSGDVLVFRQARPTAAASQSGVMHVNPIDLMGHSTAVPNAAAFVSPTGFVNYDVPQDQEGPAEAVRRSNVSVRRKEPVFSGQRPCSRREKSKKPRMNAAKRALIGGVSVASMSYALGVVGEYFTTGGADGSGPSGFSPV